MAKGGAQPGEGSELRVLHPPPPGAAVTRAVTEPSILPTPHPKVPIQGSLTSGRTERAGRHHQALSSIPLFPRFPPAIPGIGMGSSGKVFNTLTASQDRGFPHGTTQSPGKEKGRTPTAFPESFPAGIPGVQKARPGVSTLSQQLFAAPPR